MAENESAVAEQQQEEDFVYPIRIEDAGPGTKKVSVEIPREKIDSEMEKQFKELRPAGGHSTGFAPATPRRS